MLALSRDLEQKLRESVRGVAWTFSTPRGLAFSRLPEWTYVQHAHAPTVAKMAERLSGARLEIETAASQVALTYRALRDAAPSVDWIAGPSTIALTTDGYEASVSHDNGDLRIWEGEEVLETRQGENSIATFNLPRTDSPRRVTLWLPHNCPIDVVDLTADAEWWPARPSGRPRWVHYGSSISHCEDAATPTEVWPAAVARALELDLFNLGLSGCANLEQFSARTIRDLPADVISLKIGINVVNGATMTQRTFLPAVHGFIDTIRERQPNTPLLVISPICCPAHENNPGPSATSGDGQVVGQEFGPHAWIGELTLSWIRDCLKELVAARAGTDPNIYYFDGLHLFDENEALTMPDGIHPDAAGYRTIAANFLDLYPRAWLQ